MLLVACSANLHAVNVYVGGVVMDGSDRTPAYWLNGTMNLLSLYEPMPDGTKYAAMAVENGTVYMCVAEKNSRYSGYGVYVYRDGGEEIGEKIGVEYVGDIKDMAVVNGKAYLGIIGNRYYRVLKNGRNIGCNHCGEHIVAKDGALYYTTHINDTYTYVDGYYAGGYKHTNNSSLNKYLEVQRIRVINGNLYMMGKDGKGACIQTNDTRRDYIEGYGKICKDMAVVKDQYFYIIDNILIRQNGTSILSSSYIPLQIIGYGTYLYILYRNNQGAIPEYYVGVFDPFNNYMASKYKLPSCVDAYDFYVED